MSFNEADVDVGTLIKTVRDNVDSKAFVLKLRLVTLAKGVVNEGSHLAVVVVVIWVDFLCLVILSAWQPAAAS